MFRKCQQLFLEELHGCEGEERGRWLAKRYLVFVGRGVGMCVVLTHETGDDMPWKGPAGNRDQRHKKRARYKGDWDQEPGRGTEPFPACHAGSSERGRVVVDPFMGRSGGSYWPALFLYLLSVREACVGSGSGGG